MLIQLNEAQEAHCKTWAVDDRLWTTQETVELNLKTFARVILRYAEAQTAPDVPHDDPVMIEMAKEVSALRTLNSSLVKDNNLLRQLNGELIKAPAQGQAAPSAQHQGAAPNERLAAAIDHVSHWPSSESFPLLDLIEASRNLIPGKPSQAPVVDDLLTRLRLDRDIFARYADLHFDKGTEDGNAKGLANLKHANEIVKVLADAVDLLTFPGKPEKQAGEE